VVGTHWGYSERVSTPTRRTFGSIRQLKSGRWQVRFTGPDGKLRSAPSTFFKRDDAEAWLASRRKEHDTRLWNPGAPIESEQQLLSDYAETWLKERQLKEYTREQYARVLRLHILPYFGDRDLASITATEVRRWWTALLPNSPSMKAYSYRVFHALMRQALADELILVDPCRIRGAGQVQRAIRIVPATLAELKTATEAMPPHLRLMVSLASFCALRYGEVSALHRSDIDTHAMVVHIRRGVVQMASGEFAVGPPKSRAGTRDVSIPPHLQEEVEQHLLNHVELQQDSLLFPAKPETPDEHLSARMMQYHWEKARKAAGRDDLRFHDLRHTGAGSCDVVVGSLS
jgi:integrase